MQIVKILKNQTTGRIELYETGDTLVGSFPANASVVSDTANRTITVISSESENLANFGYR